MKSLFISLVVFFAGFSTGAEESKAPMAPKVSRRGGMRITYGSSPWNVDSAKPDSAFLFLRDKKTNRVVKILLEETEPDSSVFSGQFSIGWAEGNDLEPEVYIPPQNTRAKEADVQKFSTLINQGKIPRMPVISRKDERGNTVFEVYDTREQAQKALQVYKEELKLRSMAERNKAGLGKVAPSESTMDTARQAERQATLDKLAMEAKQREMDRLRMEQIERQKSEQAKAEQAKISAAARKKNQAEAKELTSQAMQFYMNGDFAQAEQLFEKSVTLDPNNASAYYKYAISLYRTEKFNEALVYIKMVPETPDIALERKYYKGLIHYRLKELDAALKEFRDVKASGNKVMAPTAAFYEGVVLMSQEKLEEARTCFEYVVDNSEDPRLDEQADTYIEQITQLIAYRKSQHRTLALTASAGLMYDSNVTYSPDNASDQGTASDKDAFRIMLAGDADYRFKNTEKYEGSGHLTAMTLLSLDENFVELDGDLSYVDPYLVTATVPLTYKGVVGANKGWKFTAKPGYELLFMDAADEGKPSQIMTSYLLYTENTFIMRDNWFATYNFDVRMDDSSLASQTGDNDLDAMKYTLKTNQMFFLDKSKKEAIIPTAGYTLNDAKGKEKVYNRIDLGVSYMRPGNWESTMVYNLALYRLVYSDATTERTDTDLALTVSMVKPISERWTWTLSANYTNNTSSLDANQYSKYAVTSLATYSFEK